MGVERAPALFFYLPAWIWRVAKPAFCRWFMGIVLLSIEDDLSKMLIMNYNYMLYKKSGRRQPTILLPKEMVKYRRAKSVCLRILLHIRYTVYPV